MTASDTTSMMAGPSTGHAPVILQVLPSLVGGGVERGTVEMTAALTEAGWTALVVSSGGPMVRDIERAGGKHIQLPVHSKNPAPTAAVGSLHKTPAPAAPSPPASSQKNQEVAIPA